MSEKDFKRHAIDNEVVHNVEEFSRPENYVGGNLITITNIAQILRQTSSGNSGGDLQLAGFPRPPFDRADA